MRVNIEEIVNNPIYLIKLKKLLQKRYAEANLYFLQEYYHLKPLFIHILHKYNKDRNVPKLTTNLNKLLAKQFRKYCSEKSNMEITVCSGFDINEDWDLSSKPKVLTAYSNYLKLGKDIEKQVSHTICNSSKAKTLFFAE